MNRCDHALLVIVDSRLLWSKLALRVCERMYLCCQLQS